MMEVIKQLITDKIKDAGVKDDVVLLTPPNAEMGDLGFGCFAEAKAEGKDPVQFAEELAQSLLERIDELEVVQEIKTDGAYVNFVLNTAALAKMMGKRLDEKYGSFGLGSGKKVMIEYPSQNTHKEFHIGHLRNVCIGNSLVSLFRKAGYEVIPVNYLNDFGRNVVVCLWGIEKFHKGETPGDDKQQWLGNVYAESMKYIKAHKDDESIVGELDELQRKLESKDPDIWEKFVETRDWSVEGFDKILHTLGVKYDKVFFESGVKDKGQVMVDELLQKKVASVGDKGAIIVDLSEYGLDIALLRKSTGAGVYMTSDLALAKEKFVSTDIEESIHITGSEQIFYFKQLFKVLELYGFKAKMTHIGYGLVNLPEGKISSREGNVVLYSDLYDQIYERVYKETSVRHEDWTDDQIEDAAKKLTLAVLKFSMVNHESNKVITFDFEQAVSFEGFSAPYILYVIARINSLLRKSKQEGEKPSESEVDFSLLNQDEEKKILLLIANYPGVVKKAFTDYNPSTITNYCFELAKAFNDFYNNNRILNADTDDLIRVRLALCGAVKFILEDAFEILTIETLEEM